MPNSDNRRPDESAKKWRSALLGFSVVLACLALSAVLAYLHFYWFAGLSFVVGIVFGRAFAWWNI